VVTGLPLTQPALLAILAGAVGGGGLFLLAIAVRGMPAAPGPSVPGSIQRGLRDLAGARGAAALAAGILALVLTRWVVAAVGVAVLAFSWRGLSGAAGERRALTRLEALATWTESLRDTIAGAVGLEQAIPASLRVAAPALADPLARLVDRLHVRVPMAEALRSFADDLADPGADLIIAALIINARLRGPGLRDLLGSLSGSVREELDMRRKVHAERRATRRSVQIVIGVSVGMAIGLAALDHAFLAPYDGPVGQLVLVIVVGIYAAVIMWLRRLARFEMPQRLLTTVLAAVSPGHGLAAGQRLSPTVSEGPGLAGGQRLSPMAGDGAAP